MKRILFILVILISCNSLFSQKAPMRIGKVDVADLEMQYYPSDSTANAAILCEYGSWNENTFKFTHLRRVKIFSKEGLANLILQIPNGDKSEVRGYVISLVDGEVIKEKISKDHIFIERIIEDYTSIRVAPPNVKEGSVIDLEYGYYGYPSIWRFQYTIPVRYSEFIMPGNEYYSFRFQTIGFEKVEALSRYWFRATDMPAFHVEPFVNSGSNYMAALMIDMTEAHVPASYWSGYSIFFGLANDWVSVVEYFYQHNRFGDVMRMGNHFLDVSAENIYAFLDNDMDRLERALHFVREKVSWDGFTYLWPSVYLKTVWDEGSGNSADINFILMALLHKMDIKCTPVLISERSKGALNPYFPTINKFNSLILCVEIDGKQLLIDASDKYSPAGILPERSINGVGLMLIEDTEQWISLDPGIPRTNMRSCNLTLEENGTFVGDLSLRHADMAAVDFRRSFDEFPSLDSYLEDFEREHAHMLVNSYKNTIEDSEFGPVTEDMKVEIEGIVTDAGELLSFKPLLINRISNNPFKLEDRLYPVDFTAPQKEQSMIIIRIPEGYEVVQLPESVSMITENKSVVFQYMMQQTGNVLQLLVRFDINKPIFVQGEYEELRTFFNLMVEKEKENIVLKKVSV